MTLLVFQAAEIAMTESFAAGALTLTFDDQRATLTFDQPARANAISQAMWRALPDALASAERSTAKVLIVTGAGKSFSAGADISEFERVWADSDSARAYADEIAGAMTALAAFPKPTLAAIRGACVGGGLGLALACDLRLCADTARFAITPGKLGLTYSLEDTKRLVDLVGPAVAKDILFTGRPLDAAEAFAVGLVNTVHAPEALDPAVEAKADEIAAASQWSARTIKATIALILEGQACDDARTRNWFVDAARGPDFQEGRSAFLARRTPKFPFR